MHELKKLWKKAYPKIIYYLYQIKYLAVKREIKLKILIMFAFYSIKRDFQLKINFF